MCACKRAQAFVIQLGWILKVTVTNNPAMSVHSLFPVFHILSALSGGKHTISVGTVGFINHADVS